VGGDDLDVTARRSPRQLRHQLAGIDGKVRLVGCDLGPQVGVFGTKVSGTAVDARDARGDMGVLKRRELSREELVPTEGRKSR
jgi:hypothetical protein